MYVRLASHMFPSLGRAEVPRRGGWLSTTAAFRSSRPCMVDMCGSYGDRDVSAAEIPHWLVSAVFIFKLCRFTVDSPKP